MAIYRCCFLDRDNHILGPPLTIDASDHMAAVDRARQICEENRCGAKVELWLDDKRIGRLTSGTSSGVDGPDLPQRA